MRLCFLDYARFFAALSVVLFHYFYNGIENGKILTVEKTWLSDLASYGHLGVQFFFIISGYVIFLSLENKSATLFMKSRLKRLYPTYWIAIIFTGFFSYLWAQNSDMDVTIKQILINFTMLQKIIGVQDVDGVYWILFYEIIFYAIVFFFILWGGFNKLLAFLIVWPILIVVVNIFGSSFLIFNLYFSFFVLGAMFSIIKNKYIEFPIAYAALIISACAGFFQIYQAAIAKGNNVFIVALIYVCMLIFFSILNIDRFKNIDLPYAKELGGMTYPLYLIHAHFGYMFLNQFANVNNQSLIYFFLMTIVLILSWFLWYLIEVKMHVFWNKFFEFLVKPLSIFEKWKSS